MTPTNTGTDYWTNTQRAFNTTKDTQSAVYPVDTQYVDKTNWVITVANLHFQLSWYNQINWVINLSSRSLGDAEIALLKKGLNFAVTPATETIAKVETAVRRLDAEQADTLRRAVNKKPKFSQIGLSSSI